MNPPSAREPEEFNIFEQEHLLPEQNPGPDSKEEGKSAYGIVSGSVCQLAFPAGPWHAAHLSL